MVYTTNLIDNNILVSFTPSEKSAIYKINFPKDTQKNLLISGSEDMKFEKQTNSFTIIETASKETKGDFAVTNTITIYVYAEIFNEKENITDKLTFNISDSNLQITSTDEETKTLQLKYAISYISKIGRAHV